MRTLDCIIGVFLLWVESGFAQTLSARPVALTSNYAAESAPSTSARSEHKKLLYKDNFKHGLVNWSIESEKPGHIEATHGVLDIDVPAGATLWFKPKLHGPLLIEYRAKVIAEGGSNDRVSDLNCFWMATDLHNPDDLLASPRHGSFAEYNSLLTYYVGLGGNGNTTTRFRRYIGSSNERPLLPENDLSDQRYLIVPNQTYTIQLRVQGDIISYDRNHQHVFKFRDVNPYTEGWFGLRTTKNHMQISNLRIYRTY